MVVLIIDEDRCPLLVLRQTTALCTNNHSSKSVQQPLLKLIIKDLLGALKALLGVLEALALRTDKHS